jgi:hypothetical protein
MGGIMTKKDKKPVSQSDPGKDDKNNATGNQSKKETIGNKDEAEIKNTAALKEAKAQVKAMHSAVDSLRALIIAEREEGIHDPSVLQAEIDQARFNWEKSQLELSQAKGLSRKRKDEIDEWKAWYDRLSMDEKLAGLERLQNEIKWRAAELDANGKKINDLILAELEARGALEMAKLKLEAFLAGAHKLPIHKDPRLASAMAELDRGSAVVASLERGQPKQK